jgi:hypothetical protein
MMVNPSMPVMVNKTTVNSGVSKHGDTTGIMLGHLRYRLERAATLTAQLL